MLGITVDYSVAPSVPPRRSVRQVARRAGDHGPVRIVEIEQELLVVHRETGDVPAAVDLTRQGPRTARASDSPTR
jgi:hypothetical protein